MRVLTSYVLRAWDAKTGRLIYDHQLGRLAQHPYRLFDQHGLQYTLPVRNWAWRSIRRVRSRGQEARYEGFDATARAAFNFICQAGTADVAKLMMLRAGPLCERYGARLLIQIHDELVFEVPRKHAERFLTKMRRELERPPTPEFRVPIVVEAKRGVKFGDLVEFPAPRKPGCRFAGLRAWLGRLVARARWLVVNLSLGDESRSRDASPYFWSSRPHRPKKSVVRCKSKSLRITDNNPRFSESVVIWLMYLIKSVKVRSKSGTVNEYVRVVEAYREGGKVKQRVVADLGRKAPPRGAPKLRRLLPARIVIPRTPIRRSPGLGAGPRRSGLVRSVGLWGILDRYSGRPKASPSPTAPLCSSLTGSSPGQ